jgi:hypothetical protein
MIRKRAGVQADRIALRPNACMNRAGSTRIAATPRRWNLPSPRLPKRTEARQLSSFHELESISERVVHIHPSIAIQRVIDYSHAHFQTALDDSLQFLYQQSRVRFGSRSEASINTEVDLDMGTLEPTAAARREFGRLGSF